MTTTESVIIGSRESQLAMWQAYHTQRLLSDKYNDNEFVIKGMTSLGDTVQNIPLSSFSDKGIFTKELDIALINKQIDCAVHCVKDLPTSLPNGLVIACYLKRGKRNDCLIINKNKFPNAKNIYTMPNNSKIGTSSLRRQAMIRNFVKEHNSAKKLNFSICDMRGNLNTRLKKVIELEHCDAIILAQIGVERLEWDKYSNESENTMDMINTLVDSSKKSDNNDEIIEKEEKQCKDESIARNEATKKHARQCFIAPIDSNIMAYCVGQGALAVMCRENDEKMLNILKSLNDIYCHLSCLMERALLKCLQGGCKIPIGCTSLVLRKCNHCPLWNIMDNNGIYIDSCQACFANLSEIDSNDSNNSDITFQLRLYGIVLDQNGTQKFESNDSATVVWNSKDSKEINTQLLLKKAKEIGESVATKLKLQGADKVIEQIKSDALAQAQQTQTQIQVPNDTRRQP